MNSNAPRHSIVFDAMDGDTYSATVSGEVNPEGMLPRFELIVHAIERAGSPYPLGIPELAEIIQHSAGSIVGAYAQQVLGDENVLDNQLGTVYFLAETHEEEDRGTLQ